MKRGDDGRGKAAVVCEGYVNGGEELGGDGGDGGGEGGVRVVVDVGESGFEGGERVIWDGTEDEDVFEGLGGGGGGSGGEHAEEAHFAVGRMGGVCLSLCSSHLLRFTSSTVEYMTIPLI